MTIFGGPYLLAPLTSLLGIRPGMSVHVVRPAEGFMEVLLPLPDGVSLIDSSKTGIDVTILFAQSKVELVERLSAAARTMAVTGAVWVVFSTTTDSPHAPTEEFIRVAAIELGLTDTRRLMLGPAWSALRLQWRPRAPRLEPPRAEA